MVHAFYHGTIDTAATTDDGDDGAPILSEWYDRTATVNYNLTAYVPPRSEAGFHFSRLGKGGMWPQGVSPAFKKYGGSAPPRAPGQKNGLEVRWPNVRLFSDPQAKEKFAYSYLIKGDGLVPVFHHSIGYIYDTPPDTNYTWTISFYEDADQNPYNNGTPPANLKGVVSVENTVDQPQPTDGVFYWLPPFVHTHLPFMYAMISDGQRRTNYSYTGTLTRPSIPTNVLASLRGHSLAVRLTHGRYGDYSGQFAAANQFLKIGLENISGDTIKGIEGSLSTSQTGMVQVVSPSGFYHDLYPGESAWSGTGFGLEFTSTASNTVPFQLHVIYTVDGVGYYQAFDVPMTFNALGTNAPRFEVDHVVWNDTDGNNNGILESGESGQCDIFVRNVGNLDASQVRVGIREDRGFFRVVTNSLPYPDLPAGGGAQAASADSFVLSVRAPFGFAGALTEDIVVTCAESDFELLIPRYPLWDIKPAAWLKVSPATNDFGFNSAGTNVVVPVIIENNGSTNMQVTAVTPSDPDTTWTGPALPWTIEPQGYVSIQAVIDPTGLQGSIARELVVTSNGRVFTNQDDRILITGQVNMPPTINTEPASQTVVVGNDAVFSVVANGSGPLSYQWQFNGTNISSTARFAYPNGLAVDAGGNVYVADTANHTIRKISSGVAVTTLAGNAGQGSTNDGTGSAARFFYPKGVAVDTAGNVYVADTDNHTVRKISSSGAVTTLAGSAGVVGSDDGTGSDARFSYPNGMAVDSAGNVYVADTVNHTIRKISSGGVVTTLAGNAGQSGTNDGTGSNARFSYPNGMAVDAAGNVYVADTVNHTIRKISSGGAVTTLAGSAGQNGTSDGTGSAARFLYPKGVAVDAAGNVYVADSDNYTIRKISSGGAVTTLAGSAGQSGSDDGIGSAARFLYPKSVAADGAGNVYVADTDNSSIRKVLPAGSVTTLAGSAGQIGSADGIGSGINPSITFANAQLGVAGDYTVVVSNAFGVANSQIAVLTMLPPNPTATQISTGSVWRYLADGSDQGTAWRFPGFDDSSWPTGTAKLGFGDDLETTVIGDPSIYITTFYFRSEFTVTNAAAYTNLIARMVRDDGAVVYLNGLRAFRNNMPTSNPNFLTRASSELGLPLELEFVTNTVNPALLVEGVNVLAVEVHQASTNSVDLGFDFELTANTGTVLPSSSIVVTSPASNAVVLVGDNVIIAASAFDPSGIARRDFYVDGVVRFRTSSDSTTFTMPDFTVGLHEITAVALANDGTSITSAPVLLSATNAPSTVYLVHNQAQWSYLADGSDQGTNWTQPNYDAHLWPLGTGKLGFGSEGEVTLIGNPTNQFVTFYFRRAFNVSDPSSLTNVVLRLLRDDGAVVYLNGIEVFRKNMPGTAINYLTLASSVAGSDRHTYFSTNLSSTLLVGGANVLAVEVHQASTNSSNLGFDLMLQAQQVPVPPFITAQPQSLTVTQGNAATFFVTAAGDAPRAYQWRFNTANVSGATNASYEFTNAQPAHAGSYSVVVSNAVGWITSSNATLIVMPTGGAVVNVVFSVGGTTIQWLGGGMLQESSDLITWTNLPAATSPYPMDFISEKRFYRVQQ